MALIAPLQAPFLEVTAPDDDMEISSDAGRVEQDNDIDLLDGDDDIDYMLEDSHSEHGQARPDELPDAVRDDIMYDDDLDEITYAEEEMHEDIPVPDENLTDVSEFLEEPGFAQAAKSPAAHGQTTPMQSDLATFTSSDGQRVPETDAGADAVDNSEAIQEQDDNDTLAPPISTEPTALDAVVPEFEKEAQAQEQGQQALQEPIVGVVTSPSKICAEEGSPPITSDDGPTDPADPIEESNDIPQIIESTNSTSQNEPPENSLNTEKSAPETHNPLESPKEIEASAASSSLQEEVIDLIKPNDAQSEAAGPPPQPINDEQEGAGPRDAGPLRSFHTTVVDYEGAHISLFPPMEEDEADTFLLSDMSLADKTLVDLFRACRQVLGDSINDSLELEIYCEDLDLTISEDSLDCMTTSFSQLVDVYVTLSQQDGVDHPEPFSIIMGKKPRWNSRLSTLYLAAAESKGLSAVQADQHLGFDTEADDDYEDNSLERYENDTAKATTGSKFEEDEDLPAQSSTESRFEDAVEEPTEESTEAQGTAATTSTDTELAHNDGYHSENRPEDEAAQEDNESVHGDDDEKIDTDAQAENSQFQFVEQDNLAAESAAEFVLSAGDDSLDQIGSNENGDDESSGSSTVQGENDHPPSSQYYLWDESGIDDSWLTDNEDTVHEVSQGHLAPANLPDSISDANPEDQTTALAEDGEWPESNDEVHPDKYYPNDPYDQEVQYGDAEAVTQDWAEVDDDNTQHDANVEHGVASNVDEAVEQFADREWVTFDEELDFEDGAEKDHAEEADSSMHEHSTSTGTFRVPDDSAGEEDEDSITYDDDELDLPPRSKHETSPTQTSSQSPLGKRSRKGDDSDQESKRLKSH